jgi:hypothetical protein
MQKDKTNGLREDWLNFWFSQTTSLSSFSSTVVCATLPLKLSKILKFKTLNKLKNAKQMLLHLHANL